MIYCTFAVISTVLILVTISIILPLSSNTSGKIGNHVSNRKAIIEKVKEETVTTLLVNENWFSDYKTEINGENISSNNIDNRDKVAIIGSPLALKLFFTTNAVGKKICIDGNQYTICGVIQESENIINSLSSDGKQRVYIPYTCYSGYENCDVYTISYDNSASSAPLIEQMKLSQYHSTNFSEKAKVIKNFEHIIYLILFIALCFISMKLWYRICKKLIKDIKENLNEIYFLNSFKSIPHKYTLLIITVLGIPTVLLVIFLLSDFNIFIISKYIPYDNILDVPYYISAVVKNSNDINSLALMGNTFLVNLYSSSFSVLVWLLVIFALFSVVLFSIVNIIINRIILLVQNRG